MKCKSHLNSYPSNRSDKDSKCKGLWFLLGTIFQAKPQIWDTYVLQGDNFSYTQEINSNN